MKPFFLLIILSLELHSQNLDSLKRFQMFHNVNTPVPVLEEIIEIKEGDVFSLKKAKRQRLRFMESGYYDDVTMLFFKKKNGIHLQYYFKERSKFVNYGIYPFLSVKNDIGVGSSIYFYHLFKSTTNLQFDINYSKTDQLYRVVLSDKFWRPRTFYRFFAEWQQQDYQYRDLKSRDRYTRRGPYSGMEIGYRIRSEETISLAFEQFTRAFDAGIYQDELEKKHSIFYIQYEKSTLDWPLFPFDGYALNARLSYQKTNENKFYRFAELTGNTVFPIYKKVQTSLGLSLHHSPDAVPHYLKFHLDASKEQLALYSRYFLSESYVLFKNKIQFLTSIEYDPFHYNEMMFGFEIQSVYGQSYEFGNYVDYWQLALNFILFWKTNKIELSINRDRFERFFFQLRTTVW